MTTTVKQNKKSVYGSKTAFIRSQPATMSAAELVAKAKAAGITLSMAQVYTARSQTKTATKTKASTGNLLDLRAYVIRVGTDKAQENLQAAIKDVQARAGL
jgi:hypothetical protein